MFYFIVSQFNRPLKNNCRQSSKRKKKMGKTPGLKFEFSHLSPVKHGGRRKILHLCCDRAARRSRSDSSEPQGGGSSKKKKTHLLPDFLSQLQLPHFISQGNKRRLQLSAATHTPCPLPTHTTPTPLQPPPPPYCCHKHTPVLIPAFILWLRRRGLPAHKYHQSLDRSVSLPRH